MLQIKVQEGQRPAGPWYRHACCYFYFEGRNLRVGDIYSPIGIHLLVRLLHKVQTHLHAWTGPAWIADYRRTAEERFQRELATLTKINAEAHACQVVKLESDLQQLRAENSQLRQQIFSNEREWRALNEDTCRKSFDAGRGHSG